MSNLDVEAIMLDSLAASADQMENDAKALKGAASLAGRLAYHESMARALRSRMNVAVMRSRKDTPGTLPAPLQARLDALGVTLPADKSDFDASAIADVLDDAKLTDAERKYIVSSGLATKANKAAVKGN